MWGIFSNAITFISIWWSIWIHLYRYLCLISFEIIIIIISIIIISIIIISIIIISIILKKTSLTLQILCEKRMEIIDLYLNAFL